MSLKSSWMKIKQYDIWIADLNPRMGTEPGKVRPVVVVQTDLLNDFHPSTIVCPVSTKVVKEAQLLRVHLTRKQLPEPSDVLVDQIRSIDNRRLLQKVGTLSTDQRNRLKENLRIVLDL